MPATATPVPLRPGALWMLVGAIASVQVGAALAKDLFGQVTPTSMTWLRLASASVVLVVMLSLRQARRRHLPKQPAEPRSWREGLVYAAFLVVMNWSIYEAFARLPLGVAVTIEFLGPLGVAVFGSRRLLDLGWAALALFGVVLLSFTPTHMDPVGVMFALVAAACWGGYIVSAARVGTSWHALDALTLACVLGTVVLAVPGISQGGATLWQPQVLVAGIGVGLLSSVLPYSLEMAALRFIPTRVFGILMSAEPAVAALAAFVVLREALSPTDVVAMICVTIASVGAARTA
ncbi:EamA family transporter [Luteococcus sp. OSA5]|uniref:EamA family transporter n=1 Tax=Luteococcus sp. OSA5 TaxID=3401630 RepID=UPI003B434015